MPRIQPVYIAFEGGEGSGKSTQARILAQKIGATFTFEPGGTETGLRLREILLSPDTPDLDSSTELLLMAADRHQHIAEVVDPNIKAGKSVVTDRSFISSLAYQGAARGFGVESVLDINLRLQRLTLPDLVFLMVPPTTEELRRRMESKGRLDKIETTGDGFHAKVAEAFGQMAHTLAADSRTEGIKVVEVPQVLNGQVMSVDEVSNLVDQGLNSYLTESHIQLPSQ